MIRIRFCPVSAVRARGVVLAGRAKNARKAGKLSKEHEVVIKSESKAFPCETGVGEWHSQAVTILGDTMTASVDGKEIGSLSSPGIAHESKQVLRLLVLNRVTLDDVKDYKKR